MPQLNNSKFLDTAEVDLPSDDGGVVMTQAKKMRQVESTSSKTKERAAVEVDLPSDDEGMVLTYEDIQFWMMKRKRKIMRKHGRPMLCSDVGILTKVMSRLDVKWVTIKYKKLREQPVPGFCRIKYNQCLV